MADGVSIRLTLTGQLKKELYISFLVVKRSIHLDALLFTRVVTSRCTLL